jgi:uncharacterized protein
MNLTARGVTVRNSVRVAGIAIVALSLMAQASGVPETEANRMAAAREYLAAVPLRPTMSEMIAEIARNTPQLSEADRPKFIAMMNELIPIEALERLSLQAMVRHFTVEELQMLTRFYGSPQGKSIMKKFPAYMGEIMPPLQEELLRAAQRVKGRL